jgi:hypothetical protein
MGGGKGAPAYEILLLRKQCGEAGYHRQEGHLLTLFWGNAAWRRSMRKFVSRELKDHCSAGIEGQKHYGNHVSRFYVCFARCPHVFVKVRGYFTSQFIQFA